MSYKWITAKGVECSPRHTNCQDSVTTKTYGPIVCSCVSDGAGSSILSELGSKALTEGMCDYFCRSFCSLYETATRDIEYFKSIILGKAEIILRAVQKTNQCELHDLSATLIIFASDGKKAVWFHVGDGVIISKNNEEFAVISAPVNGEYSNETVFVTSRYAMELSKAGFFSLEKRNQYSFLLMTDGPEVFFYSRKNNSVISRPIISYIEQIISTNKKAGQGDRLLQYLLHERCRKYSADDLSISFLFRISVKLQIRKKPNTKRAIVKNYYGRKQRRQPYKNL